MLEFLGIELSDSQKESIQILFKCHTDAARNNPNISTQVFLGAATGSASILQSICAALLTTGATHAPVIQARNLLFDLSEDVMISTVNNLIGKGWKVPGFGNSFFKDKIDPSFQEIDDFFMGGDEHERIYTVKEMINKSIFPNAAAYTAAVASYCNLPKFMELWLFLAPRTASWISLLK